MKKLTQTFASIVKPVLKVVTILIGLAGLTLVIVWISGVFIENIPPGESQSVVRMLADQATVAN